ncbi:MAG: EamA family transporter [Caulobacterales bacterium]|nr:EamA family transporter [Caulobacterales bacterium]
MTIWSTAAGGRGSRRRLALWALCAAMPILGLAYQVAAKETALAMAPTRFGLEWFGLLFRQPWAQAMLALEVCAFAAWMTVLSEMKLSAAFPLTVIGYVLVVATSWLVFHERADLMQIMGGVIILAGIWLMGRSAPPEPPEET